MYLTVAIAADEAVGDAMIGNYLRGYYGVPPQAMRTIQACYGGPLLGVVKFIRSYVEAGAQHIVVRVVGEHEATLQQFASVCDEFVP